MQIGGQRGTHPGFDGRRSSSEWMSGAARKVRLLVPLSFAANSTITPRDGGVWNGAEPSPKGEARERAGRIKRAPVVILPPAPRCERCGAEMKLVAKVEPRGPPPRSRADALHPILTHPQKTVPPPVACLRAPAPGMA
jgi:hypothetical protein